jgi:hypothetical protein
VYQKHLSTGVNDDAVILQVAVNQQSTVVQVIVQLPSATYVTNQLSLTAAIEELELDQVTFLLDASDGVIVATNCRGELA